MANAIEKFTAAYNQMSDHWTKQPEVTTKKGKIVMVKCEGYTWLSDGEEEVSLPAGED